MASQAIGDIEPTERSFARCVGVLSKNAPMASYQTPAYPGSTAFAQADPTAVVGKRILAAIIDWIIGLAVFAVAFFGIWGDSADKDALALVGVDCADVRENGDSPTICFELGDKVYASEGGDSIAVFAASLAAGLLNAVVLQGLTGASVGKHLTGLRVVDKDRGGIAGVGKNVVRWLVSIVDVSCCFLIGLIMVLTTKGHRRLGDMAAGTLVVGKQSVGVAPAIAGLNTVAYAPPGAWPAPGTAAAPPAWPQSQPQQDTGWAPPQPQQEAGWAPPQPQQDTGWAQPQQPAAPSQPTVQSYPPAAPIAEPAPAAAPAPEPAPAQPAPDPTQPQWDAARNAYIQWDPNSNQWMQWDDTNKQWRPIS